MFDSAGGAPAIADEVELETYSSEKKEVHYTGVLYLQVGRPAVLIPKDHPSPLVRNGQPASTSFVQAANAESGLIETLSTLYKPCKSLIPPYFTLD